MTSEKQLLRTYNLREIIRPVVGGVDEILPMPDNSFYSVFKVITEKRRYILKVAPQDAEKTLGFEKNLIYNECNILDALSKNAKIATPEIIYKDFSREKVDAEFIVTAYYENAVPLSGIKLDKKELGNAMFAVGEEIAKIHSVKAGAIFGYSHQNPQPSWRDAYTVMVNQIISDCHEFNVRFSRHEKVTDYINEHLLELDDVTDSVVTHCDICDRNIYIDTKTRKFKGLSNFGRGFYGDFIGDFAYFGYYKSLEQNGELLNGYRNIKHFEITKNLKIRMNLLRLYAGLCFAVGKKIKRTSSNNRGIDGLKIVKNVIGGKYN